MRADTHCAAAEIRSIMIAQLFAQGRDLFALHAEEIGNLGYPLLVNEGLFYALEEGNALITLAAFTPKERIVGYATATCTPHPTADTLVCKAQHIFVHKDYRRCGNGTRLMAVLEHEASSRGAVMLWGARAGTMLDQLLRRRGYIEVETIYRARRRS